MQMMQREYSTQQQSCLEWLSDPFAPIIGILLNHILPATPIQMRRNHADFVMAASDRQPRAETCLDWLSPLRIKTAATAVQPLPKIEQENSKALDPAKLPLNGHALALFKAKRGVHQPNGVLAMLLRNQAGDFYLAGHDASNGNVRLAQGFKQTTSHP